VTTVATDDIAAAATGLPWPGSLATQVDRDHRPRPDDQYPYQSKGFTEIKTKYPNITIVSTDYGAGDLLKSSIIVKAVIQAHPNLKGYFGANEASVSGLLDGVRMTKKEGQIVIIGYDSGAQQIEAIRSGIEAGAITRIRSIWATSVLRRLSAINGQTLPKTIDTGWHWYDKTNIDDPALAPLLY
jgi:ribose transport system substrate-binding protein